MTYCLLHFCPKPLLFAICQKADSASVILLRFALALFLNSSYLKESAVCHFMSLVRKSPFKGDLEGL